ITAGDLAALIEGLAAMTGEETAAIPSLDPKRAPVILGGAIVAEAALRAVHLESVIVSEHDLLDGVALSLLE
ncbi:MAG: exopolyphosphatase, partial [Actinomycetota bacterium]